MIASFAVIYILVLFGSFFGICAILGVRVLLGNRKVRRFVRSVRKRTESAQERGFAMSETPVEKPKVNPRASAMKLQKVRTLLRESEKMHSRRDFDGMERVLIQALTIDPTSVEARASLAKLYLSTEREPKAEAMYRELLIEVNDPSCHANLALACYKQGKFTAACHSYQSALELDPKNPERAAALGRACMAAKKFEEAAVLLEKAVERLARDTTLLYLLGECYESLGQKAKASETYHRIHRLQPYDEQVQEKLSALARG